MRRAFRSLGLRAGDRLAIYLPNTTEYPYLVFGAMLCGAVVSPSEPRLSTGDIASQLLDLKPKVVVAAESNRANVEKALVETGMKESCKIVVLSLLSQCQSDEAIDIHNLLDLLEKADKAKNVLDDLGTSSSSDEEVSLILWSSGATGRPKGIQLQNKVFLPWFDTFAGQNVLFTSCFYHIPFILSLSHFFHDSIQYFFPVEAIDKAENYADTLFKAVDKFSPSMWVATSFFMQRLLSAKQIEKYNLTSVEYISPMGVSVPKTMVQELKKHFPNLIHSLQLYCMTEIPQAICFSSPGGLLYLMGSSEIMIEDLDTGKACKPHEVGEILVRCNSVMKGYLNRPEENEKFFGRDGFVHTGDLASYDESGVLQYHGRLKTFIKFRNFQVFPEPIENLIHEHHSVKEVAVFAKEDIRDHELVTAAVVKNEGLEEEEEELANDIKELVANSMGDDKNHLSGGVVFLDELPRNPRGKVMHFKLAQMFSRK